jgi:hypothetical protein
MQWLLRITAPTLLVGIGFFYPLLAPIPHRIDRDHFRLIQVGMTEAEVEAIFGGPAGTYDWSLPCNEGVPEFLRELERREIELRSAGRGGPKFRTWMSRHRAFLVEFDARGHVHNTAGLGETRVDYPWQRWWRQLIADGG